MDQRLSAGAVAYAAYCVGVGGLTFDNKPLPTFEQLGERQRAGWEAAAVTAGLRFPIGATVRDTTPGQSITGVVGTVQRNRDGRHGYWLNCVDSNGRPFDHFVREDDAAAP